MYLSEVTLVGFKSFVEKISIQFQPGITAIVGPNGCGKSNIADAIRWVLGEQSAKLLRGDRMEDLIFAGNTLRKPVGMAEVVLTLQNDSGTLLTPYTEVSVGRRLYRSGESEYLRSNTPCRLRDITDLFLDTGLGAEPYALIEQGKIQSLIASRPADRRALLEEAAGIMKYKVRRHAALTKLAAAEQNLTRVADILGELERQRASLQRQARKAERVKVLQDRAAELRLWLRIQEGSRLLQGAAAAATESRSAQEARNALAAEMQGMEARVEAARLADLTEERTIAAAQEGLFRLGTALERDEGELKHLALQMVTLRERDTDLRQTIARLVERIASLGAEAAQEEARGGDLLSALRDREAALQSLGADRAALEVRVADATARAESARRALITHAAALATERNRVRNLTNREAELRAAAARARGQLDGSRAGHRSLEGRLADAAARLAQAEASFASLTRERTGAQEERAAAARALETASEKRLRQREDLGRVESRLQALQDLEQTFAGFEEGARHLLGERQRGTRVGAAIRAALSEVVRVPAPYERAIEALLAGLMQGLLTTGVAEARAALAHLGGAAPGRATLLLPARHLRARTWPPLPPEARVVGPATALVQAAPEAAETLARLLGDALVVEDLDTAFALAPLLDVPWAMATLAGEVLTDRGVLTGGSPQAGGLLTRRRQLAELAAEREAQALALAESEAACERGAEALAEMERRLRELGEALEAAERERREAERAFAEARAEGSRVSSQIELFASELSVHEGELARVRQERQAAEQGAASLEAEEVRLQEEAAASEAELKAAQERREAVRAAAGEARVTLGALAERREASEQALARLQQEREGAETERDRAEREVAETLSRHTALEAEATAVRERLLTTRRDEAAAAEAVRARQEVRAAALEQLREEEESLRQARRREAEAAERVARGGAREAEIQTELTLLRQGLQEETGCTLEEGAARFADVGHEPEAVRAELETLKEKLRDAGPVNMAALEEFAALSERVQFLGSQAADLRASVDSLRATIAEIERTIAGRFTATLEEVTRHFTRYWQRLFNGGEAELYLQEVEGEAGVEIRVRIPGKRMVNLNLLSGGEKALGALAFLMALFSVRPSPFCLLDEVDAALDEPNVERFLGLLRELAATTQTIIITHHPRSMEAADILYGVTMEEPGVSKVVSMALAQDPSARPVPAGVS
ncbi:MAG: chromosome segregation protein SMC [candidate division NC10 bacterium]|nr:chromosome segregation protein SMC [candidate division NC10 bacterium]